MRRCDNMNTNDLNTALYEKMTAEQDKFRDWLKSQPPEEILHHTYEYTSCLSFCRTEFFCCSCIVFLACLVNRSVRPGLTPSTTR